MQTTARSPAGDSGLTRWQNSTQMQNADAAVQVQPPAALVGRVYGGRYRILSPLAKGGMGQIFRAVQEDLGREVAIKVLTPHVSNRRPEEFRRRFCLEASTAARLNHPHSVTIFEFGVDDGTCFMAMELLRGKTLGAVLHEGALGPRRAFEIGRQVGLALQAAHAMGAIHRDIKPGNVMLLDWPQTAGAPIRDFAKVLDFGLAKHFGAVGGDLTRTGQFLGSPGYMAPEQILGHDLDGRCDVYGLGALLYEATCGRPPFAGATPHETMREHVHAPVPSLREQMRSPADAPEGQDTCSALDDFFQRAMAKRPADRFATMTDMVAHIDILLARMHNSHEVQGTRLVSVTSILPFAGLAPAPRLPAPRRHEGGCAPTVLLPAEFNAGFMPQPPLLRGGVATALHGRRAPMRNKWPRFALAAACVGLALLGGQQLLQQRFGISLWRHTPVWHLDSLPQGASVWRDGEQLCAQTPCKIAWDKPDLGKQTTLHFVRPGYDDFVATRTVGRRHKRLTAKLGEPSATDEWKPEPAPPQ